MKEKILNFLNEGKPLLWIKGQNFHEIENIIVEGLNAFENKRYYIYEKGTTINRQNNSVEVGMGNLFTTLDELYPQGIRKVPIFLLIKDSLAEIVDENNLEYIKEIVETKMANPKRLAIFISLYHKVLYKESILVLTFCLRHYHNWYQSEVRN